VTQWFRVVARQRDAIRDANDEFLVHHGTSLPRWSIHVRRGRRALTPARAGEVRAAGSARRVNVTQELRIATDQPLIR
jgi:hypothetical protein